MLLRLGLGLGPLGFILGLGVRLYEQMLKPMLWKRRGGRSKFSGGLKWIAHTFGSIAHFGRMLAPPFRVLARNDYVAVWLGMGPRWLVYLCEATGDAIRQSLKSRDTESKRLEN